MSRKCDLTGRGPRMGHKVSHAHNVSKKRWNINLQKVRVIIDGRVQRIKVSTKAIKSGLIEKPPFQIRERKAKVLRPQVVGAVEALADDEHIPHFFSEDSNVHRLFKPKKKKGTVDEEIAAEFDEDDVVDEIVGITPPPIAKVAKTVPAEKSSPDTSQSDEPPVSVYENIQPAPDDQ